jgi:flagellar hook-associated protein FlgK
MSVLQDAFRRALNTTPEESQESLRTSMTELHNSWDQLSMDLKSATAQLNTSLARWDDFAESSNRLKSALESIKKKLSEKVDTKAELGEMKTLLERYKTF